VRSQQNAQRISKSPMEATRARPNSSISGSRTRYAGRRSKHDSCNTSRAMVESRVLLR
jgi:hypothetical protein